LSRFAAALAMRKRLCVFPCGTGNFERDRISEGKYAVIGKNVLSEQPRIASAGGMEKKTQPDLVEQVEVARPDPADASVEHDDRMSRPPRNY
jgi:hypothetical protein